MPKLIEVKIICEVKLACGLKFKIAELN